MDRVAEMAARVNAQAINEIPDRVCVDKASPFYWPRCADLGVIFDGEERKGDVQEFCVSEGWILVRKRSPEGLFMIDNETGTWAMEQLHGKVEPYLKTVIPMRGFTDADAARLKAAQEKRARRAEKMKRTHG